MINNMNILIAGFSGMLGTELVKRWQGIHTLYGISRKPKNSTTIKQFHWSQLSTVIETHNIQIVINLCGENIGQPWFNSVKNKIYQSRIDTTEKIVSAISNKDIHLINASGIGIYEAHSIMPTHQDNEESHIKKNNDFLSRLAFDWEAAANKHTKTTILRTGVVFYKNGGVLQKLLMGRQIHTLTQLGQGRQPFPWISIEDWCQIIDLIIEQKILGPVNLVSPKLDDFNHIMSQLSKKTNSYKIQIPDFVVKTIFGEMGENLFLKGPAVTPDRLLSKGFVFKHTDIKTLDI